MYLILHCREWDNFCSRKAVSVERETVSGDDQVVWSGDMKYETVSLLELISCFLWCDVTGFTKIKLSTDWLTDWILFRCPQQNEKSPMNIASAWHHQAAPPPLSPSTTTITLIIIMSHSGSDRQPISPHCGLVSCSLFCSGWLDRLFRWVLPTSTSIPTP